MEGSPCRKVSGNWKCLANARLLYVLCMQSLRSARSLSSLRPYILDNVLYRIIEKALFYF